MTDTVNPTASAPASATAVLPDDFLTPVEAAGRLRISKAALYERIGTGDIPSYRFGRAIRLRATHILEYLERAQGQAPVRTHTYASNPAT
jgi:excisionase family DNA binding protein